MITLNSVCLIFLSILTDIVVCKPDYIFHRKVNGWLKLHYVPATWQDAFVSCQYEGAVLASPLNEDLATAMRNMMSKSRVNRIFIGTNALLHYVSVEGVSLAEMPVTWGSKYDGSKPEDCLTLSSRSDEVYASSCTLWHPYICYKEQKNDTILNECGTFDKKYQYESRTGSCYKVHMEYTSWDTAHQVCGAEGGYLAIVNDKTEAGIIRDMIPKFNSIDVHGRYDWKPIHIGLRDWNNEDGMHNWLTIHGEKIEEIASVIWNRKQPVDVEQICGCFIQEGYLDYMWCSVKTIFICEKDPSQKRFETAEIC